jgi:hypothetical protein
MKFTEWFVNPFGETPPPTIENVIDFCDRLLAESSWSVLPDAQITDAEKELWASYRQIIWNIRKNTTDPTTVLWPTSPGGTNG